MKQVRFTGPPLHFITRHVRLINRRHCGTKSTETQKEQEKQILWFHQAENNFLLHVLKSIGVSGQRKDKQSICHQPDPTLNEITANLFPYGILTTHRSLLTIADLSQETERRFSNYFRKPLSRFIENDVQLSHLSSHDRLTIILRISFRCQVYLFALPLLVAAFVRSRHATVSLLL